MMASYYVYIAILLLGLLQINLTIELNISKDDSNFSLEDDLIFPNENRTIYFIFLISRSYLPENVFAFAVSIRTQHAKKFFGDNHFCTGAIVSNTFIVTSAHCVIDNQGILMRPYRMKVVAACPYRLQKSRNVMEYRVAKIIPHPQFRRYHGYDIAVIFLKRLVSINNPQLEIIEIANTTPPIGTRCKTQGWGELYLDGPFADHPVENFLDIVPNTYCNILPDATDAICAANPNLNVYTCRGDSGAPLVCNNTLVGIAAYANYSSKRQSIVFIDVSKHTEWMNEMYRINSSTKHSQSHFKILLILTIHKLTPKLLNLIGATILFFHLRN